MRKIFIATALVLTTGVFASQNRVKKVNQQVPAVITPGTLNTNNKELASAD